MLATEVLRPVAKRAAQPQDSAGWIEYFQWNRANLLPVPWDSSIHLTPEEKRDISASIAVFQLGESSEGNHLRRLAEQYAGASRDPLFGRAVALFIQEEQRHAADLGRFMAQEGIVRLECQWTDSVFRFLRRFWNLRACLSVLMVAELVAQIYYKALRNATASPVLRQICSQLLRDEVRHLSFQANALGKMQKTDGAFRKAFWRKSYALFFFSTLLTVWLGHRKVFLAGNIPFRKFWNDSRENFSRALRFAKKAGSRKKLASLATYQDSAVFQTAGAFDFVDITEEVRRVVRGSRIRNGIVSIQTRHTTTAIIVNENEPLLLMDMKRILERVAPEHEEYMHNDFAIRTVNLQPGEDKNGHSHCKALFLRTSETIHIGEGQLLLGRWQRIFLLELDRAKERAVSVAVVGAR